MPKGVYERKPRRPYKLKWVRQLTPLLRRLSAENDKRRRTGRIGG